MRMWMRDVWMARQGAGCAHGAHFERDEGGATVGDGMGVPALLGGGWALIRWRAEERTGVEKTLVGGGGLRGR